MWVEKYKSPVVTKTKHAGQIITRTKHTVGGLNVKAS